MSVMLSAGHLLQQKWKLQTPSSYSFTEPLAVEELQLLPQRRGGDGLLLLARQGPHCAPEPAMLWPP